jgi:hypothetical protein
MLKVIPNKEERERFQSYFEALCVLRSFDDERIARMLAIYDDQTESWTYPRARDVRKRIIELAFASWHKDKQAYVMDGLIRSLMGQYLKTKQKPKWQQLHEAALKLYKEWQDKFPNGQWQDEIDYHQQQLAG